MRGDLKQLASETDHQFLDRVDAHLGREVCARCLDRGVGREGYARTSFGCYAGRWCDRCWPESGYRDATNPDAVFDPLDAGESLEEV